MELCNFLMFQECALAAMQITLHHEIKILIFFTLRHYGFTTPTAICLATCKSNLQNLGGQFK